MTDLDITCRRCGRSLPATPDDVRALPWWDSARVHAQQWVGSDPQTAIGLECLTPDESNFLVPAPRRATTRRTGRFTRGSGMRATV